MNDPVQDTAPAAPPSPAQLSAFLTCRIDTHEYGVDILKVHEIVGLLPVTPLHGSPRAISGVVNLRGSVVPVMSLRTLFNLGPGVASKHNVFIIIEHDQALVGLAVDQVLEVVRFTPAQIEPPREIPPGIDPSFITAVGTGHARPKHLLEIDRVLGLLADQAPAQ